MSANYWRQRAVATQYREACNDATPWLFPAFTYRWTQADMRYMGLLCQP